MSSIFEYAIFSDKGDRQLNEDSVGIIEDDDRICFILCDGLGGHGMGDVASQKTVEVFKHMFIKMRNPKQFLRNSFCAAEDILISEQSKRHATKKMKTTAVTLLCDKKKAYIGHIGDSRLYVFSNNQVRKRTLDHSIPQMLALSGEIKESEIRNHPERNILLNVLGTEWDEPQFETQKPLSLKNCQAFLLCSDGFWELIEETTMCSLLSSSSSVNEWLSNMVSTVRKNGQKKDMDNFSAIAVWKNHGVRHE